MSTMRYRDYLAVVEFDEDIGSFFGRVVNTNDVITFYGASVVELRRAMKASIDSHLEFCRRKGMQPSKAFSGRFNVRLSPEQHRDAALAAAIGGKSLNRWVAATLAAAARHTIGQGKD